MTVAVLACERLGVVGSGSIACGLAAAAAPHGPVTLWARSQRSAARAGAQVQRFCERSDTPDSAAEVEIVTDLSAIAGASAIIEAVVEDFDAKAAVWADLRDVAGPGALLGSTTSSLSIQDLAAVTGAPDRFVGFYTY